MMKISFDDLPLVDLPWVEAYLEDLGQDVAVTIWEEETLPKIWPDWMLIEAAVERADWHSVKKGVHSLRTPLGQYGLKRIWRILQEWEEHFSDPEAARLFLPMGEATLRDSLEELRRWYPAFFPPAST